MHLYFSSQFIYCMVPIFRYLCLYVFMIQIYNVFPIIQRSVQFFVQIIKITFLNLADFYCIKNLSENEAIPWTAWPVISGQKFNIRKQYRYIQEQIKKNLTLSVPSSSRYMLTSMFQSSWCATNLERLLIFRINSLVKPRSSQRVVWTSWGM